MTEREAFNFQAQFITRENAVAADCAQEWDDAEIILSTAAAAELVRS